MNGTATETHQEVRGRRDQVTLGLLVSAQFLVMMDTSIVNVALPSIQSDLGFGPAAVTWVVNAYVLAFAGLLLLSGRAADLFGRRRLFIGGACLFTVGTLLAALAVDQEMLIVGRAVQGVGAAALSPAAMSLLLATFPAAQRGRAMGAWGARLARCSPTRASPMWPWNRTTSWWTPSEGATSRRCSATPGGCMCSSWRTSGLRASSS